MSRRLTGEFFVVAVPTAILIFVMAYATSPIWLNCRDFPWQVEMLCRILRMLIYFSNGACYVSRCTNICHCNSVNLPYG